MLSRAGQLTKRTPLSVAFGILALAAGLMMVPTRAAFATHNTCDCEGTQCAYQWERWCCLKSNPTQCGCTFFTSCGES